MAKETPKKVYESNSIDLSSCRLCRKIGDAKHCKNLFKTCNILKHAEELLGEKIHQDSKLPHLICRPCERRVVNFASFKQLIKDTQNVLRNQRVKRCIEISPSVKKPEKCRPSTTPASSARRLRFNSAAAVQDDKDGNIDTNQQQQVKTKLYPAQIQTDNSAISCKDLLNDMVTELKAVTQREGPSVLRKRSYDGMSESGWMQEIKKELETRCPTVHMVLTTLLEYEHNPQKKFAPICLIYSIILFRRCHELSRVQRINTVLLTEGQASTNVISRLSCYGFCLDASRKYDILDDIGKHHLDRAVELVQSGKTFTYVIDNIDWDVKVHDMREQNQNKSMHAVASNIVFDRVSSVHLPDNGSQKKLQETNLLNVTTLNNGEWNGIRKRLRIIIAKIISNFFPNLSIFEECFPKETYCLYSEEMKKKSHVVSLPVLMKDEKKYSDIVDVLDQLETWTCDIYHKAGRCIVPPHVNCAPNIPIQAPARPDQPGSHIPPIARDDDPISGIKIPCFGDQLTRVRSAGAKDLRAGAHTPRQRLEHIYPFRIVDWHPKRSFLKSVFKRLYTDSTRQKGTLRYFRDKLQRRNVSLDVKHYEACEQLFLSVGKCFVVEALLEFFDMDDTVKSPRKHIPPLAFLSSKGQREQYCTQTLDNFIDTYILKKEDNDNLQDDKVRNYSINLMRSFITLADFKDAVATGNGQHLAILHKLLLKHFFSVPGFNTYAIEMLISIIQNEILLSPAEAHQSIWAATANWKGGANKNIEIDLLQENSNRDIKTLIKLMGANKTDSAIARASRAAGGVRTIIETFDEEVSIHTQSSSHCHKSSSDDEQKILQDLRQLRPFKYTAGRKHTSFPNISANPIQKLDNDKYKTWLARHKKNIEVHFPVDGHDEDEDEEEGEDGEDL